MKSSVQIKKQAQNDLQHNNPSLYDIIKNQIQKKITCRILYASLLQDPTLNNNFEENMVQHIKTFDGNLTGFMIFKGTFILHLIQGEFHVLNQHMKYVNSQTAPQGPFLHTSILLIITQSTKKYFDRWSYQTSQNNWTCEPQQIQEQKIQKTERIWQLYKSMLQNNKSITMQKQIKLVYDDLILFFSGRFMKLQQYWYIGGEVQGYLDSEGLFPQPPDLIQNLQYLQKNQISFI